MAEACQQTVLQKWERKQRKLKNLMIDSDTEEWQRSESFLGLGKIGGVDLSFIKEDNINACASLVILSYPDLQVIYEDYQMVRLTAPYIAGFLAFREAPYLVEAVDRLRKQDPSLVPQVILVDGNGLLHYREFGLACHLGVLTDIPCIGVAKNLLQVDGLESRAVHKEQIRDLHNGGDQFRLLGSSGKVLGMALKSCEKSSKPIYVSVGHRISLESAVRLIHSCCKYRVPEPIRQADIRSREYIRTNVLQTDGKAKQSPNSLMRKKLHKASSASSCTKPSPSAFQNHPCEDYEDSIAALFEECCI